MEIIFQHPGLKFEEAKGKPRLRPPPCCIGCQGRWDLAERNQKAPQTREETDRRISAKANYVPVINWHRTEDDWLEATRKDSTPVEGRQTTHLPSELRPSKNDIHEEAVPYEWCAAVGGERRPRETNERLQGKTWLISSACGRPRLPAPCGMEGRDRARASSTIQLSANGKPQIQREKLRDEGRRETQNDVDAQAPGRLYPQH